MGLAEKVLFLIILVYPVNLLASGCNLNLFLFTRNLLALELRQVQISRFLAVNTQQDFRVYTRQKKPAVSVRGWPKIKTRQPVRHPRRV